MKRKVLTYSFLALIIAMAAIQFIQPVRKNPPVDPGSTFEAIAQPSPAAAAILHRSCYDCHSNSTRWPWYSHIAPMSWIVADDVKDARHHMNFSEWNRLRPEVAQSKLEDICNEVRAGDMPLWGYTLIHRGARLSPSDKEILCNPLSTKK